MSDSRKDAETKLLELQALAEELSFHRGFNQSERNDMQEARDLARAISKKFKTE